MALRLGAALWWFWQENGSYHEGWSFFERALEGSEEVAVPVRAKALLAAGNMCDYQGRQSKQGETLARRVWRCSEQSEIPKGWELLSFIWE